MRRKIKQLVYFLIFSFFFLLPIIFVFLIKKSTGTCYDGIQNQGEEGIDCGGPCPPCELKEKIVVRSVSYLLNPDKSIDLIAKIENKEEKLGLKNLRYQFLIYDVNGFLKDVIEDETIIFPGETRYVVKIGYKITDFTLGKVDLKILEPKPTDWKELPFHLTKIPTYNEKIFLEDNKLKLSLSVYNNTNQYFSRLEVIAFVYEEELFTVGKTEISLKPYESKDLVIFLNRNFLAGEEKLAKLKVEIIFQKLEP